MKQKTVVLCAVFLLAFGLTGLQAQEAVSTTGGDATGSGGTIAYSAGQVVYTLNTGTNGSVAQGVQQPYEISIVTGIEEAVEIMLIVTAYPNPTSDYLLLKAENDKFKDYYFQLFDLNGKLFQSNKLEGYETEIDMSNLSSGAYFLRIFDQNKEIKTFKIFKNSK